MACKNICRLCDKLILSTGVTYSTTTGNLVITIPAGSYANGEKYCIVVAQTIPNTATVNAPVVVQIGTGTDRYPVVTNCCKQLTAASLRNRTKYSTIVETTSTGGQFKLLGNICNAPNNDLAAIDGGTTT